MWIDQHVSVRMLFDVFMLIGVFGALRRVGDLERRMREIDSHRSDSALPSPPSSNSHHDTKGKDE